MQEELKYILIAHETDIYNRYPRQSRSPPSCTMTETQSDAAEVGTAGILMIAGTAVSMFSGFVLRILIARNTSPAVFGAIVVYLSALNLASIICLMGFNQGIIKYISGNKDHREKQNIYITIALSASISLGVVAGVVLFAFSDWFSSQLFSSHQAILFILALSLPFSASVKMISAILRGYMNTSHYFIYSNLLLPISKIIFVGVIIQFVASAVGITTAILLSLSVVAILGVYMIYKIGWRPDISKQVDIRDFVWYSLPLVVSASLHRLLSDFDKFLISSFKGTAAVGQYEVAIVVGGLLGIFRTAFSFLLFPKISELDAAGRSDEIQRVYKYTTKAIMLFSAPLFILIITRPDGLIMLFGEDYSISSISIVLTLISSSYVFNAVVGPNGEALLGFGRSRTVLVYNMIAVIINLLLNVLLIPRYGIIGAAIALFVGYSTMNILKSVDLYHYHDVFVLDYRATISSIIVLLIGFYTVPVIPKTTSIGTELATFVTTAGLLLILNVVLLYLLGGITNQELQPLKEEFKKL